MYETLKDAGHESLSKEIFQKIKDLKFSRIYSDTTANWAIRGVTESLKDAIYIYTDYKEKDGVLIPGIKIGTGNAYIIDLPFIDEIYANHILDTVAHITQSEREFWNNKVTCYIDPDKEDKIIFTKG